MNDKSNITYLLGAGASYNACPILNQLAEKMIAVASFQGLWSNFSEYKSTENINEESIMYDIGYFGNKAKLFGTIDTYAKKLYLNSREKELNQLKLALSSFFTIWENIENAVNIPGKLNHPFRDKVNHLFQFKLNHSLRGKLHHPVVVI